VEAKVSPEEPCFTEGLDGDKSGEWVADLSDVEELGTLFDDISVDEAAMEDDETVCWSSETVSLRTAIASALVLENKALALLTSSTVFSNFLTELRKELAIVLETVLKETEI
jgi:hypothetical protein